MTEIGWVHLAKSTGSIIRNQVGSIQQNFALMLQKPKKEVMEILFYSTKGLGPYFQV